MCFYKATIIHRCILLIHCWIRGIQSTIITKPIRAQSIRINNIDLSVWARSPIHSAISMGGMSGHLVQKSTPLRTSPGLLQKEWMILWPQVVGASGKKSWWKNLKNKQKGRESILVIRNSICCNLKIVLAPSIMIASTRLMLIILSLIITNMRVKGKWAQPLRMRNKSEKLKRTKWRMGAVQSQCQKISTSWTTCSQFLTPRTKMSPQSQKS